VHNAKTFGVELSLAPGQYSWHFDPALGATFTDSGSSTCHGAP
jgi:hypothetical protein